MIRFSDTPIWLRLTGAIWLMMVAAFGSMIVWETRVNRDMAIEQAKDFAGTVNEMTMAGLTGMMITGTVAQRDVFLDQIKELSVVQDLEVIRGEAVSRVFGAGGARDAARDADERLALVEGRATMRVDHDAEHGEHLRVVIPSLASPAWLGKDCIACHQVPQGTPLGAVSMRISLDKANAAVNAFRNQSAMFAALVSIPLILFIYLFITRFVTRPLDGLNRGLGRIAEGGGDLRLQLPVRGRDEIGRSARTFNDMMGTLGGLVRQVGDSASAVTEAASRLAADAEAVAASSQRQNESSVGAADAVDEMVGSISAIAEHAEAVRERSHDSLERSREGQRSLERLVGEVGEVEAAVRQMADAVVAFVDSTQAISRMTSEVREIAEQTNLLALNAAIEAARAGEQGRGFAVVADEVRGLAERTAVATVQIEKVIEGIQNETRATVGAMAEVSSQVDGGVALVGDATDSLHRIRSTAGEALERIREVAYATGEQSSASTEIARQVQTITEMADGTSGSMHSVVVAAEQLQGLAAELDALVGRFRC